MIGRYIDQLTAAYPAQITLMQNTVDLLMPYAMIGAGIWLVWQGLCWIDRWIDRSEARRVARMREPDYRTANANQFLRDLDKCLIDPYTETGFWEPWRDTMPPAEHKQHPRKRAGPPTVVPFPSQDAQRRRQP